MPVFSYTFKKFWRHKSTWTILILAFLVNIFLIGYIVFKTTLNYSTMTAGGYLLALLGIYGAMGTFFVTWGSIFTGFVGSKVFRDEVEDGTFLVILSKPTVRGRVIFEKWLAYSFSLVIFCIALTMGLLVAAWIWDKPNPINPQYNEMVKYSISHNAGKVFLIITGIGLVICFIFSSLALIFSTKLSVGATIGMTIGVGIAVPISSLIGLFSNKETHTQAYLDQKERTKTSTINYLSSLGIEDSSIKPGVVQIPNFNIQVNVQNVSDFANLVNYVYAGLRGYYLGNVAIKEYDSTSYIYTSYVDLDYQIKQLGQIAASSLIPIDEYESQLSSLGYSGFYDPSTFMKQEVKQNLNSEATNKLLFDPTALSLTSSMTAMNILLSSRLNVFPIGQPILDFTQFVPLKNLIKIANEVLTPSQILEFNKRITTSPTDDSINARSGVLYLAEVGKMDQIKYVDYINKYWILATYLTIAVVIIPLSYIIIRRQDFV